MKNEKPNRRLQNDYAILTAFRKRRGIKQMMADKMGAKIIIDTNALMAIIEFKMDILNELERVCDFPYTVFILQGTIDELEKIIREQRGKFKQAARLVLSILGSQHISVIQKKGNVDDLLAEYSQGGALVLTQDIELKRRLTKPYLIIRQKKKIMMVR